MGFLKQIKDFFISLVTSEETEEEKLARLKKILEEYENEKKRDKQE